MDTSGGTNYPGDPTCGNHCKSTTKYYKCDTGKCIPDTGGGTNYPGDPTCGNHCKTPKNITIIIIIVIILIIIIIAGYYGYQSFFPRDK